MSKKQKRIQGKEWWDLRRSTKLQPLCVAKATNYRVFVKTPDGLVYSHYLNPIEVEELKNSEWIKTHKIYPMSDLYSGPHLIELLNKGISCYEEELEK